MVATEMIVVCVYDCSSGGDSVIRGCSIRIKLNIALDSDFLNTLIDLHYMGL